MNKVYVNFQDLGRIDYKEAWDHQQSLLDESVRIKQLNRNIEEEAKKLPQKHHLLFCEHSPVYTLGKSGSLDHLLLSEEQLKEQNIQFFKINRGGDITYHGPGQIVAYPILDMEYFFTDIHRYVRYLEEMVIRTLAGYGLEAIRLKDYTGVWLPAQGRLPFRKICAIGVHLKRWITMHGFAFNINTDLDYFKKIVPCGIDDKDKEVTSLSLELGREVPMQEVKWALKKHFENLFGAELF